MSKRIYSYLSLVPINFSRHSNRRILCIGSIIYNPGTRIERNAKCFNSSDVWTSLIFHLFVLLPSISETGTRLLNVPLVNRTFLRQQMLLCFDFLFFVLFYNLIVFLTNWAEVVFFPLFA